MKNLTTNKKLIIIIATFILAIAAVFTAIRLYQLGNVAVAPNVPESEPRAVAIATAVPTPNPLACSLGVTVNVATPSPTPVGIVCSYKKVYKDDTRNTAGVYFLTGNELVAGSTVVPGQKLVFGVRPGPGITTASITITDQLPTTFNFLDSDNTCSYSSTNRTVSCSLPTTNSQSSFRVVVANSATGTLTNTASVSGNGNTTTCSTNVKVQTPSPTPSRSPSPTPTRSPSPTPTRSPSPTPTRSPSPTPTRSPSPTPVAQCNSTCTINTNCPSGMVCSNGHCRNPACTSSTNCLCPTPTPSPSPTTSPSPGPNAICSGILAYDSAWNQIESAQLSTLTAGNNIEFCVAGIASGGSFDMARFTINGGVQPETTTKRPDSNDYCQAFVIPAGVYAFDITAQLHHVTLGWVGP